MNRDSLETFRPRAVSRHGVRDAGPCRFKVYGLRAPGREVADVDLGEARAFLDGEVVPILAARVEDHGLGFLVVHPGDLGTSFAAHWWVQGSVLCQRIRRRLHGADEPLDMAAGPVVACVWELAIIGAEQALWRETMMTRDPDPRAYLDRWAPFDEA